MCVSKIYINIYMNIKPLDVSMLVVDENITHSLLGSDIIGSILGSWKDIWSCSLNNIFYELDSNIINSVLLSVDVNELLEQIKSSFPNTQLL